MRVIERNQHKLIQPFQLQVGEVGIIRKNHNDLSIDKLVVKTKALFHDDQRIIVLETGEVYNNVCRLKEKSFMWIQVLPKGTLIEV